MTMDKCPESFELTRAVSEGLTPAMRAHLDACPSCAKEWKAINDLVDIGKDLPYEEPSRERLDQVRLNIYAGALSSDSSGRKSRRGLQPLPLVAVAFVVLFLLTLAFVGLHPFSKTDGLNETARILVVPQGIATYSVEADLPNQVIRLVDGTIKVSVDSLGPGENVRVVVGKSHVVVHGTAFEVAARENRLIDVRVLRGQVEVRHHGQLPVTLATGSRLSDEPTFSTLLAAREVEPEAPAPVAPSSIRREPPAKPLAERSPAAPEKPAVPKSLVELAFEEGWRELKAGRYPAAAEAFSKARNQNPSDPLVEDATYWLAVSLKYAGRTGEALSTLESFLKRYPASPRRGEVSVMLGWIHFHRGSLDFAHALFLSARNDRVASVRESAEKGLSAIEERQQANSDVFD